MTLHQFKNILQLNVEGLMSSEVTGRDLVKDTEAGHEESAVVKKGENELALQHLSQGLFFVQK